MSDYVTVGDQADLDFINWQDWEAAYWASVDDAAQEPGQGDDRIYQFRTEEPRGLSATPLLPALHGVAAWPDSFPHGSLSQIPGSRHDYDSPSNYASVLPLEGPLMDAAPITSDQNFDKPLSNPAVGTSVPKVSSPVASASVTNVTVPAKRGRNKQLTCPHIGCTHEGTFPRQYELERHIRVKHGSKKPFLCPYPGCFKGQAPSRFARSDKLTAHIRTAHHRQDDLALRCPAEGCIELPMTPDLLSIHIQMKHSGYRYYPVVPEAFRPLVNAASSSWRQCFLGNCGKQLRLESLVPHMMSQPHSVEQINSVADELRTNHYLVVKGSCSCGIADVGEFAQTCVCASTAIELVCPVCPQTHKDHDALREHLDEDHLVSSEQRAHFIAWRDHLRQLYPRYRKSFVSCTFRWEIGLRPDISCPYCGEPHRNSSNDHHVRMLEDPEHIKPFRRDILKLYPDFAQHPVWTDLA